MPVAGAIYEPENQSRIITVSAINTPSQHNGVYMQLA
jgi:hypothetical protein